MTRRLSFLALLLLIGCGTTTVTPEPIKGPDTVVGAGPGADQAPATVEDTKPLVAPAATAPAPATTPASATQVPPEPAKPAEPEPAPVETPKPEEPRPVEPAAEPAEAELAVFPAVGTEAFSKLVAVTDIKTILAMLEEKARSDPNLENQLIAAGALLSAASQRGKPDQPAWESADLLSERIKINPDADAQWVRMLRAQIERLTGQPERALRELNAAYRQALREMPPEVGDLYFTYASIASDKSQGGERMQDADGYDLLRRLPDGSGQNDVYNSKDTIYVAYRFRFFSGTPIENKNTWHYKIQATAELFDAAEADPQRARITTFNWQPRTAETKNGRSPDLWEAGRWTFSLPYDIKSQRDYVLKITFTDLNAPKEKNLVGTKEITIKVR